MGRWMDRARKVSVANSLQPATAFKVGEVVIVKSFSGKEVKGQIQEIVMLSEPGFKPGIWIMFMDNDNPRWVHHSLVCSLGVSK